MTRGSTWFAILTSFTTFTSFRNVTSFVNWLAFHTHTVLLVQREMVLVMLWHFSSQYFVENIDEKLCISQKLDSHKFVWWLTSTSTRGPINRKYRQIKAAEWICGKSHKSGSPPHKSVRCLASACGALSATIATENRRSATKPPLPQPRRAKLLLAQPTSNMLFRCPVCYSKYSIENKARIS